MSLPTEELLDSLSDDGYVDSSVFVPIIRQLQDHFTGEILAMQETIVLLTVGAAVSWSWADDFNQVRASVQAGTAQSPDGLWQLTHDGSAGAAALLPDAVFVDGSPEQGIAYGVASLEAGDFQGRAKIDSAMTVAPRLTPFELVWRMRMPASADEGVGHLLSIGLVDQEADLDTENKYLRASFDNANGLWQWGTRGDGGITSSASWADPNWNQGVALWRWYRLRANEDWSEQFFETSEDGITWTTQIERTVAYTGTPWSEPAKIQLLAVHNGATNNALLMVDSVRLFSDKARPSTTAP